MLALKPPETHLDDKLYNLFRRTTRALLFYMATRDGMITRDEMMSLFWAKQPEIIARCRLAQLLQQM